ncbi:MAG: hypothetical protein Q8R40_01650 [bacterium]|nr:hypothetical protein [bacterium]
MISRPMPQRAHEKILSIASIVLSILFGSLSLFLLLSGCATITSGPDRQVNTSHAGLPANDEPSVHGHPTDSNSLVAGAHEYFQSGNRIFAHVIPYHSNDGGLRWQASDPLVLPCTEGIENSADPWVSGNTQKYNVGFISLCRNLDTGAIVGWMRAVYTTSTDNGATWPVMVMISPENGHADKIHMHTSEQSTYASYVFFGIGEIKIFSSAAGQTVTIGRGNGPVTVETGTFPPVSYTAYVNSANHLIITPITWTTPPRIESSTDMGIINPFVSPVTSCDGAFFVVPGTRIRHMLIPQIARGGTDGNTVYVAINNYDIATSQLELVIFSFRSDTSPAIHARKSYRYDKKRVIMPSIEWVRKDMSSAGNLVATFYLASIENPYLWDYVRLDLDDQGNVVAGPMVLNSKSPLNFFGVGFAGDYTKVTGRAPDADGQLRPYGIWTDPRNHTSTTNECASKDTVGTDIYGR